MVGLDGSVEVGTVSVKTVSSCSYAAMWPTTDHTRALPQHLYHKAQKNPKILLFCDIKKLCPKRVRALS